MSPLEPIISDRSAVTWQIFKRVQSVEVIDGYPCHRVGLRETNIDSDAAAALLVRLPRAPERDAAARRAEMEFERLATKVRLRSSRDDDSLAIIVVCPEHSVAPAHGAIASRRPVRLAFVSPLNRTAMTGSLDHFDLVQPVEVDRIVRQARSARPVTAPMTELWTSPRPPVLPMAALCQPAGREFHPARRRDSLNDVQLMFVLHESVAVRLLDLVLDQRSGRVSFDDPPGASG